LDNKSVLTFTENNSAKNRNIFKNLLDEQIQKRISAENKVLEVKAENKRLMKNYCAREILAGVYYESLSPRQNPVDCHTYRWKIKG
jgi:hypothetical protein